MQTTEIKARDGKFYNTDVVDESGLNTVTALIPSKKSEVFARWMKNMEYEKAALLRNSSHHLKRSGTSC